MLTISSTTLTLGIVTKPCALASGCLGSYTIFIGDGSSITPVTLTPLAPSGETGAVLNITWRARYGWPLEPVALSAFDRLLATTFSRCDCAAIDEAAIPPRGPHRTHSPRPHAYPACGTP